MLFPLFDKDYDLVAWIKPGEHIFDVDMNWVGGPSESKRTGIRYCSTS